MIAMSAYHLAWILPATALVFLMLGGILQGNSKPITRHDDIVGLSREYREARRREEADGDGLATEVTENTEIIKDGQG